MLAIPEQTRHVVVCLRECAFRVCASSVGSGFRDPDLSCIATIRLAVAPSPGRGETTPQSREMNVPAFEVPQHTGVSSGHKDATSGDFNGNVPLYSQTLRQWCGTPLAQTSKGYKQIKVNRAPVMRAHRSEAVEGKGRRGKGIIEWVDGVTG